MSIDVTATTPGGRAVASFAVTDPAATLMGWDLTPDMVGPRIPLTRVSGPVSSTHAGQVIEGLEIPERINILHSGVVVRDCRIEFTAPLGLYPIYVRAPAGGAAPRDVVIEHCEIVGSEGANMTPAVWAPAGGWTLRGSIIAGVSRGPRLSYDCVVEHNIIRVDRSPDPAVHPDPHRSGLGCNWGARNVARGNDIRITEPAASAALALYTDQGNTNTDYLIEGNLLNGGSITARFGDGSGRTSGIVVRNNRWGTDAYPGNLRPAAFFEAERPGNTWAADNTWQASGQPVAPQWVTQ